MRDQFFDIVPSDVQIDATMVMGDDGLKNARILAGDLLGIRLQSSVENGQLAVIALCCDPTKPMIRFFHDYPEKNCTILSAANPTFLPLVLEGEERKGITVIGRIVRVFIDLEKQYDANTEAENNITEGAETDAELQ